MKAFPRWFVAAFFAAFLLLGFLTAADYGSTWDEVDEMDILRMNLWEYSRALGLDETAFEKRAAQGAELTISVLTPISESIEKDHGICAFYPLSGVVMNENLSEAQKSQIWHMGCWAVFTLGAFALYAVCRQLGLSRLMALLGPVMLLLSPQFFAHGHFNNKDIALFSLALCVLWQGLRLLKKPAFSTALWFSLFGAMAANTKVVGGAIWGLCALFVLIEQIWQKNLSARVWAVAGVTALSFFGFYALLTPALWADPLGFAKYLISNAMAFTRWENSILFRGAVFELWHESLPAYYLPYMMLATTPLWVLLMMAVGALALVGGLREKENRLPLLLTGLLWALPLGFAVLTRTHVYNGWRHFYFLYGPMLVMAVWGVHWLWRHARMRRVFAALLAACMALSAVGIVREHPYQYAYYQPLVQLRGTDYNELDYWNISARDALCLLAEQTEGELSIASADLWTEDALKKAILTLPQEMAERFVLSDDAQYVLANATYVNFSGFTAEGMQEKISLTSYGQPIMRIYERTAGGEQP